MPNVITVQPQENSFARYLEQWMYNNWREDELNTERQRQDEDAKVSSIVGQYQKLTPQQQAAVWPTLPPAAQQRLVAPGAIPEDPWQAARQKHGEYAAAQDPASFGPEFTAGQMFQNNTDAAMPSAVTQAVTRRSALTPEEIQKGERMGYTEMTPAQAAEMPSKIDANAALAEQRRTPKVAATSGGGKQAKAPQDTAAAKAVADLNRQLKQASDRQQKALSDLAAAKAKGDTAKAAAAKAIADQSSNVIKAVGTQRNRILAAMKQRGMATPQEDAASRPDPLGVR